MAITGIGIKQQGLGFAKREIATSYIHER